MIYTENNSNFPQRVYIPRDREYLGGLAGYQFQRKDLDIHRNGDYYLYPDEGFDAITASTIHVEVPTDAQEAYDQGYQDGYEAGYNTGVADGYESGRTEAYAEGYASGFAAGVADQKAKLSTLTATTNGHYSSEDGYGDVYVNVEGGGGDYSSGYTDGMAAQKALLTSTTITDNGHYTRENGWNEIDVRLQIPSLHTAITENGRVVYLPPEGAKGFDSVEIDVNVPQTGGTGVLSSLTVTENGNYAPEQGVDGFSAVTVNVAQTGETYPRSNVTLELFSDDYEGLSGVTIHFDANGSPYSAFTVVDSSTTVFTAVYNPGVQFHVYATIPVGYQGTLDIWDTTYWNEDKYNQATINRYTPGSTSVVTARTTNDVSDSDFSKMKGLVFNGSASAWTAPTGVTYDSNEDKWYLEYPGTLVKGFIFDNSFEKKIVGVETSSELTHIIGFEYATNLEYVQGQNIRKVGGFPDTGFGGCTALTSFTTSSQITELGASAFEDCWNLSSDSMFGTNSLSLIGDNAFKNCYSIHGYLDLNGTSVINSQAFAGCTGITNVYIAGSCTLIDDWAFSGCTSLNWIWSFATTAPRLGTGNPFTGVANEGTLFVPTGSDYSAWMTKLPSNWTMGYFG
jgi:hypothetical protein